MNNNGFNLLLSIGFSASVSALGVLFFTKKVSLSIQEGTLMPEKNLVYK